MAFHGVSGAGLSTTVLPVASAWPSLCEVTSNGKFHGTMAPTTPTGSRQIRRESSEPCDADGVGQHRLPLELVDQLGRPGQRVGERRVELRAVRRHARAADLEDELLAQLLLLGLQRRRAAARGSACGRRGWSTSRSRRRPGGRASMARCISAVEASATWPMTSSVAGLTLSKVLPESASTSLPSMSIRCSGLTFTASAHGRSSSRRPDPPRSRRRAVPAATRNAASSCLGSLSSGGYLTLTSSSKMAVLMPGFRPRGRRRDPRPDRRPPDRVSGPDRPQRRIETRCSPLLRSSTP